MTRKEHYLAHREQILADQKRYREKHREQRNAQKRQYWHARKEEINSQRRERFSTDPIYREKVLASLKRRYQRHKDPMLVWMKEYREAHKGEIARIKREDYQNHWTERRAHQKEYYENHPEEFQARNRQLTARRRDLGFVQLNQSFEGSHAHHIDKIHVICIPEELHMSVRHDIHTGKNMDKINAKAFAWLEQMEGRTQTKLDSILHG